MKELGMVRVKVPMRELGMVPRMEL